MPKTNWEQTAGRVIHIDSIYPRGRRQLIVAFTYEVEGKIYEGTLYTFDSMHEGDSLVVKYDPLDPKRNDFQTRQKLINRVAVAVPLAGAALLLLWFSLRR